MLKLFLLLLVLRECFCGIFEYTEFDDPYSIFFQRPLIIRQHHGRCTTTINGQSQEGICLTRPECNFSGGRPQGREGCILGTCCVYSKGCSQQSNKRISYFDYTGNLNGRDNCQYIVNVESNNICQMRIDFESLNLRPPRQAMTGSDPVTDSPYECRDEFFEITSPLSQNIPVLCGNNNGQHMYVNVNASGGQRHLVMRVVPDPDVAGTGTTEQYTWRIKVTQLECPGVYKHQKVERTWEDFPLLAPNGCLQYFLESSGEIRNFGYDKGKTRDENRYSSNLDYSICFRRTDGMCGIRFTVDQFSVTCNMQGSAGDFLMIPDGQETGGQLSGLTQESSRFCGRADSDIIIITSVTSGPFYVRFKTEQSGELGSDQGNGFVLRYALLRGNSCT